MCVVRARRVGEDLGGCVVVFSLSVLCVLSCSLGVWGLSCFLAVRSVVGPVGPSFPSLWRWAVLSWRWVVVNWRSCGAILWALLRVRVVGGAPVRWWYVRRSVHLFCRCGGAILANALNVKLLTNRSSYSQPFITLYPLFLFFARSIAPNNEQQHNNP